VDRAAIGKIKTRNGCRDKIQMSSLFQMVRGMIGNSKLLSRETLVVEKWQFFPHQQIPNHSVTISFFLNAFVVIDVLYT